MKMWSQYTTGRALFSPTKEPSDVIFWKMDVTGDHHIKQNKPDSGR